MCQPPFNAFSPSYFQGSSDTDLRKHEDVELILSSGWSNIETDDPLSYLLSLTDMSFHHAVGRSHV